MKQLDELQTNNVVVNHELPSLRLQYRTAEAGLETEHFDLVVSAETSKEAIASMKWLIEQSKMLQARG